LEISASRASKLIPCAVGCLTEIERVTCRTVDDGRSGATKNKSLGTGNIPDLNIGISATAVNLQLSAWDGRSDPDVPAGIRDRAWAWCPLSVERERADRRCADDGDESRKRPCVLGEPGTGINCRTICRHHFFLLLKPRLADLVFASGWVSEAARWWAAPPRREHSLCQVLGRLGVKDLLCCIGGGCQGEFA
jgi:hypothetical protein